MHKRAIYIAHPLGDGPDRELNRQRAARWVCWFAEAFDIAPIADWIVLSSVWGEERRALGMDIDRELMARADELWLCGGEISEGMHVEALWAYTWGKPIVDFTEIGLEPPSRLYRPLGRSYAGPPMLMPL
jgi:hypothetical protein